MKIKSSLRKTTALALAFVAAVGMTAGCSVDRDALGEDVISTESEFTEQAADLLQKSGFTPLEVREFEKVGDKDAVAFVQYVVLNAGGTDKGLADVSCSSREVLHMGTHCQIASLRMSGN